jgi:hypothetical protein
VSTVRELKGGDLVTRPGRKPAVFVTACPHPQFHRLVLVIWRLHNGRAHFDALHPDDEVGDVQPIEPAARDKRLTDALINAPAPEVH